MGGGKGRWWRQRRRQHRLARAPGGRTAAHSPPPGRPVIRRPRWRCWQLHTRLSPLQWQEAHPATTMPRRFEDARGPPIAPCALATSHNLHNVLRSGRRGRTVRDGAQPNPRFALGSCLLAVRRRVRGRVKDTHSTRTVTHPPICEGAASPEGCVQHECAHRLHACADHGCHVTWNRTTGGALYKVM